jgi:hypothetical protein
MTEDLHSPTNAGPDVHAPDAFLPPESSSAPGGSDDTWASPAAPAGAERPEVLVGAAFAGGLVAAMILKRLGL